VALPMILDCDPGHDDMVALLLASRHADLLAITTVAGNAPLDRSTHNALVAAQLFNLGAAVHSGAARPLIARSTFPPVLHGESGLDGPSLPTLRIEPSPVTAVEAIIDTTRRIADCWLVATGPLTNIALALRADPTLANRIAGISIMGGGIAFGNITPSAEFNFWADPEAASIVLTSGVPLVLAPLDVTHQLLVTPEFSHRVRTQDTSIAEFMADLFDTYAQRYQGIFFEDAIGPLHDPCAVLALTHPELFEFQDMAIEVATGSGPARGATLADRRGTKIDHPASVRVAVTIDSDAALELVIDAIAAIP